MLSVNFGRRTIPENYLPQDWDHAWALGWFRMRQTLFTAHFLEFDRKFYSAVWLRVGLARLVPDRKFLELKKLNRRFRVEFGPCGPDGPSEVQEALYTRYRQSVPFEPAPSLRDLLLGDEPRTRFPTWEVSLYDGDRLVALGIFDRGASALAGIVCCYDPDYRKNSLGKYLIYLKMEHGRSQGLQWFYPGYVAPGQPRFDYKWTLGAATLEYLDLGSGCWLKREPGMPVPDPLADMEAKLSGLGPLRWFLHLDINLNPQVAGMGLFDFPVFFDCFPDRDDPVRVVVIHDPRDGLFHLLHCRSVYRFSGVAPGTEIFETDLLAIQQDLLSTVDPPVIDFTRH